MNSRNQSTKNIKTATKASSSSQPSPSSNAPRNHIIKDAQEPYTFVYRQYGQTRKITVAQTAEEETWPGGALWDIGVLLAKVLVMVNTPPPSSSSSGTTTGKNELYVPRIRTTGIWPTKSWKECCILELGCGVGLTGLVAASLGSKLTLLTDLDVVVNRVTIRNVELNKHAFGMGQKVIAVPLCWGDEENEECCKNLIVENLGEKSGRGRPKRKVKKGKGKSSTVQGNDTSASSQEQSADPDIILIGDVAYQHKPGAPSHFDILLSTLLKFATKPSTTVVFGTRMRMPASMDLLEMFREHFDEVVSPVEAQELDTAFHKNSLGRNSMITIHFFKRKANLENSQSTV